MNVKIRPVATVDIPAIKTVIDGSGLFPSDMLDDMISGYLTGNAENEFWLTAEIDEPVAVAYYVPERMTDGTWNLLLIAVHPDHQGRGYGAALMKKVEASLADLGARVLLVETSGLPNFERTRAFYDKLGYDREARIRDFYQAGDDKIIFRKTLAVS
jgi:ribosomal protein S18 acetylase RimI-like enzyme